MEAATTASLRPMVPRETRQNQWICVGLLVLACAVFCARVLVTATERRQPVWDEVDYLAVAREYAGHGGTVATIQCYAAGQCRNDTRDPLYILLLAPAASDGAEFFETARFLTFGTALLLLASSFLTTRRRFGLATSAGTVIWLCSLPALGEVASKVLCDVLLAACAVLAVHLIAETPPHSLRWSAVAGVAIGLTYLTKGNGYLLLAPLVCVGLRRDGLGFLWTSRFYAALAGFIGVSGFLLWRNAIVFGNPLHHIANKTAWLDRWSDVWTLSRTPEWDHVGLRWYLQHHGVWDLTVRAVNGLGDTLSALMLTAGIDIPWLGPLSTWVMEPRRLTGILLVGLASAGMVRSYRAGRQDDVLAVVSTLLVFLLAFSVGAQGIGGIPDRFVLPLVVLLVPYAVSVLVEGWTSVLSGRRRLLRVTAPQTVIAVVLGVALIDSAKDFKERSIRFVEVPDEWHETSTWLAEHLAPRERFALPSNSNYSTFDLACPDPDPRWVYAFQTPAPAMIAGLRAAHVALVVIDVEDPELGSYRSKLSSERDQHGALTFLGWPRVFADSGTPSRFLIYRERSRTDPQAASNSRTQSQCKASPLAPRLRQEERRIQRLDPAETLVNVPFNVQPDGESAFTVTGSGFQRGDQIHWNGERLETAYASPRMLTGKVPSAKLAPAGTVRITVGTTPAGSGSRAVATFLLRPVPVGTAERVD
jgi:hypothetical protein